MAKPKVPKAKKPRAKPKRKNPVAQKQKQRQSVNVRVINNNGGTGGGGGRTDGVRTVPITTYPLFREQYDVAPITLNKNSLNKAAEPENKLPDTSAAPPPVAAAPPPTGTRAERATRAAKAAAERVVVPPIPAPTPVRAPFTSPNQKRDQSPSGGLNFGNTYSGGNQNFQYMSRGEVGDKQKRDEFSDSDNRQVVNKKPKSRVIRSEREDDEPPPRSEARERLVLTRAQMDRNNAAARLKRKIEKEKKANEG